MIKHNPCPDKKYFKKEDIKLKKYNEKSPNWKGDKPRCIKCNKQLVSYTATHCLVCAQIGNKNNMWKGDKVGYCALHEWIKNRLPKPETCEECHAVSPYDLANRSNKYKRDLSDWEWLCRKCHMEKDGRIKKLSKFNINKKLKNINCLICNKYFHPKLSITKFCSTKCYHKSRETKTYEN